MSQQPLDYQSPVPHRDKSRSAAVVVGAGIGAALTIPAVFLAMASGGAGHGTYFFARLFFPYPMLLTPLTGNSIAAPSMVLAFLQLPIEGALIGLALSSKRPLFAGAVVGAHLVAFGLCSSLSSFT
jgi:hypothetical protein